MTRIFTICILTLLTAPCLSCIGQMAGTVGPHLIVYKTKGNYNNLVPVLLSNDKKSIISYPAPGDIRAGGKSTLPTRLKKGYLIDNRGINENVAFLNITYAEYGKLTEAPTVDKLYGMIKDKDPLVSMCDCGLKDSFRKPKSKVNSMICWRRLFRKCTAIKR